MREINFVKVLMVFVIGLLITGAFVPQVHANAIYGPGTYFTFDRTWQGAITDSGTWGTMALTDSGNDLIVNIDLAASYRIDVVYLNYADGAAPFTPFSLTGIGTGSLQYDQYAADGYPGRFDLRMGTFDTGPTSPYSGVLSATGLDLNPEDFFLDDFGGGNIYAALRILDVNLFQGPGELGNGAAWLLASTAEVVPVPEPSTFLLLGVGLAGLAFVAHRRKKE